MAINPVTQTNTTAIDYNNAVTPATKEATPAKPQPAITDTVKISSAAQTVAQEATETAAQTAREASNGDRQAQRLIAKENAAEEAKEASLVKSQEAQGTSVIDIK